MAVSLPIICVAPLRIYARAFEKLYTFKGNYSDYVEIVFSIPRGTALFEKGRNLWESLLIPIAVDSFINCKKELQDDSKMHNNRIILCFIETGK